MSHYFDMYQTESPTKLFNIKGRVCFCIEEVYKKPKIVILIKIMGMIFFLLVAGAIGHSVCKVSRTEKGK